MNLFEIKQGYKVLLFDEYPILFIGFNHRNEVIVGSFLYEKEDNTLLYFRSIVSNKLAIKFVSEEISYLDLLKNARDIFIINEDYNENIISVEKVNFIDIDESILPLSDAYCPSVDGSVKQMLQEFLYGVNNNKHSEDKKHKISIKKIFEILEQNRRFINKQTPRHYYQAPIRNTNTFRSKEAYKAPFEPETRSKYALNHE